MENLCDVCATLNLPYHFDLTTVRNPFLDTPQGQELEIELGCLEDVIDRSSSCAFCAFLLNNAKSRFDMPQSSRGRTYIEIDWSRTAYVTVVETMKERKETSMSAGSAPCKLRFDRKWPRALGRLGYDVHYIDRLTIEHDNSRSILRKFPGSLTRYCDFVVQLPTSGPFEWGKLATFGQLCASNIPVSAQRLYERRLNVSGPDFGLLRAWLRTCLAQHGHHCEHPPNLSDERPKSLRVIDVRRRCVVLKPADARYAALSYVWGGPQFTASEADLKQLPWHLPEPPLLSPVVADALKVCRELDLEYLWVDALCIVQQPAVNPDKAIQIQQMDIIYSSAVLTICATSSKSASQGIPGLRARPVRQEVITCEGKSYAKVRDNHYDVVDGETWNRRAWTYQERLLSPRVMFITEQEVFWICQCEGWAEGIVAEPQDTGCIGIFQDQPMSSFNVPPWAVSLHSPGILRVGDPVYRLYKYVVWTYTRRQLGDYRDTLNAIDGVLRGCLRAGFKNGGHVMGLPVSYFDISLLWRSYASRTRVDDEGLVLPSWSWTAWSHHASMPIRWDLSDNETFGNSKLKGAVRWKFLCSDGSSVNADGLERGDGKVPGLKRWAKQGERDRLPPPIVCGLPPAAVGYYMHFRTTMISLALGPKMQWFRNRDPEWSSEWESHRQSPYELLDKAGECVGHTILPENVACDTVVLLLIFLSYSSNFDFKVQACKGLEAYKAPTPTIARDFHIVNAMAVELSSHSPLFYERITLAKVYLKAWMAAGPESRWIVLG